MSVEFIGNLLVPGVESFSSAFLKAGGERSCDRKNLYYYPHKESFSVILFHEFAWRVYKSEQNVALMRHLVQALYVASAY